MNNYTKGEWEVYTGHDNQLKNEPLILASRGDRQPGTVITKLVDCGKAETLANAHLIAAAPKMAEWIDKVAIRKDGWINQADLDEAKEILKTIAGEK